MNYFYFYYLNVYIFLFIFICLFIIIIIIIILAITLSTPKKNFRPRKYQTRGSTREIFPLFPPLVPT